jgi:outer membrane usher protein
MLRLKPALRVERLISRLLFILLLLLARPPGVSAADPGRELQLQVSINGQDTQLIAPFTQVSGRGFLTTRRELEELFIRAPGAGAADEMVRLDQIPGLKYSFDESAQTINLVVSDVHRLRRSYDAHTGPTAPSAGRADYGVVLNYNVLASGAQNINRFEDRAFSGANAALDARVITPHGVLNQTAVVGTNVLGVTETLRLETYGMRVDPETLKTYRVGDMISGGVNWSRPFRMAGAQIQHNYAFRPDLVTGSLPSVSGSAAVPSTVDVYVNNIKTFSQNVGSGPYQINNLPVLSGSGEARVVLRDASGREQESTLAFYNAPRLLREGVYESSLEMGAPRLRYGIASDDYEAQLVAAATLRRGFTDWLTLETHAEAGLGIVNGGIGVVARANKLGVLNLAISGSSGSDQRTGGQAFASLDTKIGPVSLRLSTQRTFAGYDDIASVTARLRPSIFGAATNVSSLLNARLGLKPARALDNVSASIPLGFDKSSLNATFLRIEGDDGQTSRLGILSYSRPLIAGANLYATAFHDFDDAKSRGIFVGIHIPLGETRLGSGTSSTIGVAHTALGNSVTADVTRSLGSSAGDWGWRIRDTEGAQTSREASVSHRMAIARVDGSVRQEGDGVTGRVQVDGAVVVMGGGVYLANRVDDSFGVVSAGTPGIKVSHENNVVGETNAHGKVLIPSLRSYQQNKISVDPTKLPIDAEIDKTSVKVTPAFRSGVYIDFDVKTSVAAALVVFKGADGAFLPTGSEVVLMGGDGNKVVGYDGQVYLNGLARENAVTIKRADGGTCQAAFKYERTPGVQSLVGPVVCQ